MSDSLIIKMLKTEQGVRITYGHRWLVWGGEGWTVCGRRPYQRKTRLFYCDDNLALALQILQEDG